MREYSYHPDVVGLLGEVDAAAVHRVLVVGAADYDLDVDAELRVAAPPPGLPISCGAFIFPAEDGLDLMIVVGGARPGAPEKVSADGATDHPVHAAQQWFGFLWQRAEPISGGARFSIGDTAVRAGTGEIVTVAAVHRDSGTNTYTVTTQAGRRRVTEEGLGEVSIDASDPTTWIDGPIASADEFATGLTVTKLSNPLTDTIYSFQSSKTVLRPYQFKPVLKLLSSPHQRLLIADEVGLGKTIEAGLIWSELEARNQGLNRVLVVCPAVLVHKWQDEMARRFDRRVPILDGGRLRELVDAIRGGDDSRAFGIVSLERLRLADALLADLNDLHPRFDLVIVDEAHYLRNRSTKAAEVGNLLSTWADTLVFLSATPLNLGREDLFNLLTILVPEEFSDAAIFAKQVEPNQYVNRAAALLHDQRSDPQRIWAELQSVRSCELGSTVINRPAWERVRELCEDRRALGWQEIAELKRLLQELNTLSGVLTRTRKIDVPDAKAVREPLSISVQWTPEEAELYRAVRRWAEARARRLGGIPGFATQMPLRQAASCLPAVIELIGGKDPHALERPEEDDFDDFLSDLDAEVSDRDAGSLTSLAEAAERARGLDTKFDGFAGFLEREVKSDQQVLLFSFFRRTLSYLERRLTELGISCRVLHGGITKMEDRQKVMNQFRQGQFQVLLCSEVGSEGLDFEFCHTLVNYDLPWNPMRVEQRIGRLDRFGQTSERLFILNFHVPGTIETEIFDRLYRRIRVFEESIGELEPILREDFAEITKVALDPDLSDAERQRRLDEIEVALEERRQQLDDLQEAQAYLAGIDQLLIDGFERDTTSRGRYVGPDELRNLLEQYFSSIASGRLTAHPRSSDRWFIEGGVELGDAVARVGSGSTGSAFTIAQLAAKLRDEEPLEVTFSNEDASRTGTELVSLRHPITRAAVAHLAKRPMGLKRFASLRVDDLPDPTHTYVAVLCLAETSGLRPSLELWPITVDLDSGEFDESAGFALLAGAARHRLSDGQSVDHETVKRAVERVLVEVHRQQRVREDERRRDNEALVESRLATRRSSIEHRLRRAERTLAQVRQDGRSMNVQRMHEGVIRNLKHELSLLPAEMEQHRELSVSVQEVAVALLTGTAS